MFTGLFRRVSVTSFHHIFIVRLSESNAGQDKRTSVSTVMALDGTFQVGYDWKSHLLRPAIRRLVCDLKQGYNLSVTFSE